jgi:IMP dehydrogenase
MEKTEKFPTASEIYDIFYGSSRISLPPTGYTLDEVRLRPVHSDVAPNEVDLSTQIGTITMKLPILSAAMDTVAGDKLSQVLAEVGGCGVIYRHKKPEVQLELLSNVLGANPCMVKNPMTLRPEQTLEEAREILADGYSTIPVISKSGMLEGILFTGDVAFKDRQDDRLGEPVRKWMKPFSELKVEYEGSSFEKIRDRLLNEQECSTIPIIDKGRILKGIYFMKDFIPVNLAMHNGKLLVGMAIGIDESDLERAREGVRLGAGIVVIDSSHGNCGAVIRQAVEAVRIANGNAAVIAGNIADVDGYLRLSEIGVDGVKCGIGSGSICTTSAVTGAGVPMFTLIRELAVARRLLLERGFHAPVIIPDGGINTPGNAVVALAAGGHLCMAGQWLVAAEESLGAKENGMVKYRGMASKGAIESRLSYRYGKGKRAAEGVEGWVPLRGPLKKWIEEDIELIQGGFAHAGARNIKELHEFGNDISGCPFIRFTNSGSNQISTRVFSENQ